MPALTPTDTETPAMLEALWEWSALHPHIWAQLADNDGVDLNHPRVRNVVALAARLIQATIIERKAQ